MANPKISYDEEEIDDILLLYKKSKKSSNTIFTEYKPRSVSNFNAELVVNKVRRSNGKLFTLYKYHFWAGKQPKNGDYNYGKKRIMQLNQEIIDYLGYNENEVEFQEILKIIDKNYKNKSQLTSLICHNFKKIKNKSKTILNENIKLEQENQKLKKQIVIMQDVFTNIIFNSQNPNNSLNDMLSLKKSGDEFINQGIRDMFEDGTKRFEMLANLSYESKSDNSNELNNILYIKEKKRQDNIVKSLEEDGF